MHAIATQPGRHGHRWRRLRESWLAVDVDLDRAQPVAVATDIDALSRAIERLAASGGFALALAGEGGPCADARLVVEDCGYELGAALREALVGAAVAGRMARRAAAGPAQALVELEFADRPGADCAGVGGDGRIGALPAALVPAFFQSFALGIGARIAIDADGGSAEERFVAGCAGVGDALREVIGSAGRRRPEGVSRR
jgi:imidazoleglycerol phosphate dehydratase HisB